MQKKIVLAFAIIICAELLFAAPPIKGKKGFIKQCGVNSVTHKQYLAIRGIIRPTGTPVVYNVLVIRVEFQLDYVSSTTGDGRFSSLTTQSTVEEFMDRMNAYYQENSYGLISVSATVTTGGLGTNGSYILNNNMSYYGSNYDDNNFALLLNDSVQAANSDYNFRDYDHYMVFHAGAGEETDVSGNSPDDIWSVYVGGITGISADLKPITNATFVPETGTQDGKNQDSFGIICHEYAHQLGLPDLYRTDGSNKSSVGVWSIMDYGIYSGNPSGSNPTHFDAWSKLQLGLINPRATSGESVAISLKAAESMVNGSQQQSDAFIKIEIPTATDPDNEFFLVEYRLATAEQFDNSLPASGIVIWHIDDNVGSISENNINNDPFHRRVDLIEQDNTDASIDYGSAGDVFGNGNTFSDQIYPSARAYNGKASGISIVSISGVGGTEIQAEITKLLADQLFSILRINNYPNPARNGTTTFYFAFKKPPQEITLDIFTINGENVRKIPSDSISLNSAKSENYNWVYEYFWNGKNDNGDDVAPGLYLYRVSIDDETKTGKMALIR
ncbi:MAG: M6 family metalloprotease domain-containing protein [bacterium]